MASLNGLGQLGLPKLSEKMDPGDARRCAVICTSCRSSCNIS